MTKQTLVAISVAADLLDVVVVGQIPLLSWVIDLPVIALHVAYAGPKGLFTLLELIPFVGTVPFFTLAALSYAAMEGEEEVPPPAAEERIVDTTCQPIPSKATNEPPWQQANHPSAAPS